MHYSSLCCIADFRETVQRAPAPTPAPTSDAAQRDGHACSPHDAPSITMLEEELQTYVCLCVFICVYRIVYVCTCVCIVFICFLDVFICFYMFYMFLLWISQDFHRIFIGFPRIS